MPSTTTMTMRTAVLFLLLASHHHHMASGFYIRHNNKAMIAAAAASLTQFHGVSFNDFSDEIIGDATSEEGQELAQEFYEQLRRREEEEQEKRRQLERLEQALRYGPKRPQQQPSQSQQQRQAPPPRVRQDVLDFEKEFRKWTGQTEEDEVTSAGFFRGGSSVYSYPSSSRLGGGGGSGGAMKAYSTSTSSGAGGAARTMDDDDENVLERAMLGVLPYLLALAVVVSLAMGSGALETSNEYDVFQDPASSANGVTAGTLTASVTSPFATAESSLQQHMDQVLLRKNCVML